MIDGFLVEENKEKESHLENTLESNFDEIAALQAELGNSMDSMFSDLMMSIQSTTAKEKCDALKKKLCAKIDILNNRKLEIQSLPSSPRKYTNNFNETINKLINRLNKMMIKCNDIPSMQLPMFQIQVLEEELDFVNNDTYDQIDRAYIRRLSFQVSLETTEKAKLNVLRLLHPPPKEEEEKEEEDEEEDDEEDEKKDIGKEELIEGKEKEEEKEEEEEERKRERETTNIQDKLNQQNHARNELKEALYNEMIVEKALAALENNKMECEEFDQREREKKIELESQRNKKIHEKIENDKKNGWRERIRMLAAEKQQVKYNDSFWGIDLYNQQNDERLIGLANLQDMIKEEQLQCSMKDTFWGIDDYKLQENVKNEEIIRLMNVKNMINEEYLQCSCNDQFWGIDAHSRDEAMIHRKRLLHYQAIKKKEKKKKEEKKLKKLKEAEEVEEAKGENDNLRLL